MERFSVKNLRIGFVTGNRSDFAKIRPYLCFFVQRAPTFVFATSMHTEQGFSHPSKLLQGIPTGAVISYADVNRDSLAQEMSGLVSKIADFLTQNKISFLFVHGDRVEALAAATAGACCRIPVCHIEAGDESGNIDETFRHAITKLSNRFLVDDELSRQIVLSLGEEPHSIHIVGNATLSALPNPARQKAILKQYGLIGKKYILVLYHPETDLSAARQYHRALQLVSMLQNCPTELLVIDPNNDAGAEQIKRAYQKFTQPTQRIFHSFSLEEYLTLLQHAVCLVGNSSSGVKEAPLLQVPSINIGSRQQNRAKGRNYTLFHSVATAKEALPLIQKLYAAAQSAPHAKTQKPFNFQQRLKQIFTADFFCPDLQKEFHFSR